MYRFSVAEKSILCSNIHVATVNMVVNYVTILVISQYQKDGTKPFWDDFVMPIWYLYENL